METYILIALLLGPEGTTNVADAMKYGSLVQCESDAEEMKLIASPPSYELIVFCAIDMDSLRGPSS